MLEKISIRTRLQPGDIGYVIHMHGKIYKAENNYGLAFEAYVAQGLAEFCHHYNPQSNRVWICEYDRRIIGFLLLMKRGGAAQLRYFIIEPEFRRIGLGKKLMDLFMNFLHSAGYKAAYLWTTDEQLTAAHLYTSRGFVLTEKKESALLFSKSLTELKYELYRQ